MHYQVNYPSTNRLSVTSNPEGSNQAIIDARLHAEQDYQSGTGACLGAGCGLFGIAGSYLYEGQIPVERLQALESKSPTYQLLYRQEYVKETRRLRTKESIGGYLVVLGVFVFLIIVSGEIQS